jgi:RNA polymerase sigma factor (sigma-70 family)
VSLVLEDLIRGHLHVADRAARRARRVAGGDLEELRADALVGLWRAARKFDPARGKPFASFAFKKAVWEAVDGRRTRTGRRRVAPPPELLSLDLPAPTAGEGEGGLGACLADPGPGPGDELELADEVEAATRCLSPGDREALALRFRGWRLKEIGRRLGYSESNAFLRVAAALGEARAFHAKGGGR